MTNCQTVFVFSPTSQYAPLKAVGCFQLTVHQGGDEVQSQKWPDPHALFFQSAYTVHEAVADWAWRAFFSPQILKLVFGLNTPFVSKTIPAVSQVESTASKALVLVCGLAQSRDLQ